jgi:hypothetical protein
MENQKTQFILTKFPLYLKLFKLKVYKILNLFKQAAKISLTIAN